MRKLLSILLILFSFNLFAKAKVAIVGAGPAGLTSAYFLAKKEKYDVTIFEKENIAGGKVKSVVVEGVPYEIGAIIGSRDFRLIRKFSQEFDVRRDLYIADPYSVLANGDIIPYGVHLLGEYPVVGIGSYESWLKTKFRFKKIKRRYWEYMRPGFPAKDIPQELTLTPDEFKKEFGISPFVEYIESFVATAGYGYFDNTPMLYQLQHFTRIFNSSVFTLGRYLPQRLQGIIRRNEILWDYFYFPNLFSKLWNTMAKRYKVRFNSEVNHIFREGDTLTVQTKDGKEESFDKVIITTDARHFKDIVDLPLEQRKIFEQVEATRFVVTLVKLKGLKPNRVYFFDENKTSQRQGHLLGLVHHYGPEAPYFVGYQIASWDQDLEDLKQTLIDDLQNIPGVEVKKVGEQYEWNYNEHFSGEALNQGLLKQGWEIQGENGIYYAGGPFRIETTEDVARLGEFIVDYFF